MDCHFLLQRIFLTQGLNPCLALAGRFSTAVPPRKPTTIKGRSQEHTYLGKVILCFIFPLLKQKTGLRKKCHIIQSLTNLRKSTQNKYGKEFAISLRHTPQNICICNLQFELKSPIWYLQMCEHICTELGIFYFLTTCHICK